MLVLKEQAIEKVKAHIKSNHFFKELESFIEQRVIQRTTLSSKN